MITYLSLLLLAQLDWRAAVDRYKASGDAAAALAIVEKQQPRSSALEDETGFLLAALRRRPEAIVRFREAIRLAPANASAHYHLGVALWLEGDRESALKSLTESTVRAPDNLEYWQRYAVAANESGDRVRALAAYQRVVALKPTCLECRNSLSFLLVDQGFAAKGQAEAQYVLAREPKNLARDCIATKMNHLHVWPYRFHFLARSPAVFPQHQSGNILRGAFGTIFRRIACEPRCPGALACEIAHDCPYAQVFEPRWESGPSGLTDPPRAFVFRPTGLEGRNLQSGEAFSFDLHLFSPRPDLLAYFVLAFRQLGVEGIGPGRARVELVRLNALKETGEPATGILRIRFLTPTEFKEAGSVAIRPEFGPLFRRLANRIGNLCALYQGERPAGDLEALTHAADRMRIVGGTVSWAEVERRSSKTGQRHSLGGFTGTVDYQADYQGDYGPFLPWLSAARWTGVGRQTVWGKGSIEAVEVNAAGA